MVTADWLNQWLTLLDYDKLIDGESDGPVGDDVPLGIAISSDGTRAYTANFGTDEEPGNTLPSSTSLSAKSSWKSLWTGAQSKLR